GVEAKPRNALSGFVHARLVSIAIVLGTGFLLVVSLVLTSTVSAMQAVLPTAGLVWGVVDVLLSLALLTVTFALLFKFVPDVKIAWRDTWFGAALTAVMFTIGKLAIGIYLGRASVGSAYGAGGSVVGLMGGVYYAALIFFFGAVATKVIAQWRGSPLQPSEHARSLERDDTSLAAETGQPAHAAPS